MRPLLTLVLGIKDTIGFFSKTRIRIAFHANRYANGEGYFWAALTLAHLALVAALILAKPAAEM